MQSHATAGCESNSNAMLAALTLNELVSLCESKREKLQLGPWQGEMGRVCLNFLVGLAGLSWPELPAGYTLLQHHAWKFLDFRGEDGKIMKSLKCAVHVLYTLSTSTALGEGIGLVCRKSPIAHSLSLIYVP